MMKWTIPTRLLLNLVGGLLMTMGLSGCGGDKAPISAANTSFKAADDSSDAKDTENGKSEGASAPNVSSPPVDPLVGAGSQPPAPASSGAPAADGAGLPPTMPPTDEAAQLLALARSELQEPTNAKSRQEAMDQILEQVGVKIKAAERVLTLKTTPANRTAAMETKLMLLTQLVELQVPEADKHIRDFVEALEKDPQEDIARKGRMFNVSIRLGEYTQQKDADFAPLEQRLVEALKDPNLSLEQAQAFAQGALQLLRSGAMDEGQKVLDLVAERFKEHNNPEINQLMAELPEQAKIYTVGFEGKRDAFLNGNTDETRLAYTDMAKELLTSETKPGSSIFQVTAQAAVDLERAGNMSEAQDVYGMMSKAYEATTDKNLGEAVTETVTAADRRHALIGAPLSLDGVTLYDDTPLDVSKYKGKHVLIHFWSPQSRYSMQEFQQLIDIHKTFQPRGLEILGVAVGNPALVKQFFSIQKLDWDNAVDVGDPEGLAMRSGVTMLPFSVFVNPEGEVEKLYVVQPGLMEMLEAALPAAKAAPAETPGATEPAPAAEPATEPAKEEGAVIVRNPGVQFVALWDDEPQAAPGKQPASPQEADPPATKKEQPEATEDADKKEEVETNPYLPRDGMTTKQLVNYIFDMEDRPKSIQARPGFSEALVATAEKILEDKDAKEAIQLTAIETKFWALHRLSVAGNEKGDKQLMEYVKEMNADERSRVASIVEFMQIERRVLDVDELELDVVPDLLEEAMSYCEANELNAKHLRFASGIVHAVNRIEDDEEREEWFKGMGEMFVKSDDRQLSRYGKRIAKSKSKGGFDAIGKQMDLVGSTVTGLPFDWTAYKGKVVIVDFWATWCGPCVREMPNVQAFYRKHKIQGLEIVGVSLDKDLDAVAAFVEEKKIPWETLVGEGNQDIATTYGVRGIPTLMLVDQSGKVVAAAHNIAGIAKKAEEVLANKQ